MKSDCFIDTNIWVYAFLESEKDSHKQTIALKLLQNLSPTIRIVVSTQVINEFHWTLSRKYKISDELIHDKVENGIIQISEIVSLDYSAYQNSFHLRSKYCLSFWDSLIIATAQQHGCRTIFTEDMNHGMELNNSLKIVNPFLN